MFRRTVLISFAAVLTLASASPLGFPGGETGDDLGDRLDTLGAETVHGETSGLSLALSLGGDSLFTGAWGHADPETSDAATVESSYRAGVLTEPFLATAILRLAESGILSLDDPITKHLGRLEYDEPPTLRQLLAHTSGVPDSTDLVASREASGGAVSVEDVVAWLEEEPLESTPGSCFAPNASNTLLLGLVLEGVTRMSVPAALESIVFEPAEMTDTRYCHDGPPLHASEDAHLEGAGDGRSGEGLAGLFWAEGLCTTAPDLVRWVEALADGTLLSEEGFHDLFRPRRLTDGTSTPMGLGVHWAPLGDFEGWSTGGTMGGGRVHVAHYPQHELTVAMLAHEGPSVGPLGRRVARTVLELPEPGILDLALDPEQQATYAGSYFLGCNEYLVAADGKSLEVLTPRGTWRLAYQGDHTFLWRLDSDVRIVFEVEEVEGRRLAVAFELEEHGAHSFAKRMR